MKSYPRYKDSGVEWIGEVPEGWEVKKLKYCFSFHTGWTPPTTNSDYFIGDNTWITIADIKAKYLNDSVQKLSDEALNELQIKITKKGSLLYSFKLSVGKIAFAGKDLYTNEAILSISPMEKHDLQYYYYALPECLIINANENIYGAKILNQDLIRNSFLIVPPKPVQKSIATYLDRKTTQIDDLISKKQKLIELLKEERAAIINQAVTKGLNPDAPMKDSEIEWLGEVPEHWEVKRLKYVASINEENLSEKTDANIEIKYIDIGNVCLGSIVNEPVTMYFKDAPSRARRIVRKGDTIISTVRTYLKAIAYISDAPQNLIVSTGFAVIRSGDDFDKKFISFLLTSEMIVDTICSLSVGVSYPAINASDIANIMIWFSPDKTEQAAIVEHVNKTTTKIDQATSKIEKQIGLLKEYRTALISEVVTGKIDVRDGGSNG